MTAPQKEPAGSEREAATLAKISDLLTTMFCSARAHVRGDDEAVVGYTVQTGALHKIVGLLASYKPVIIPSNMPTAHETITGILTATSEARASQPSGAAGGVDAFLHDLASQKPEKPDHWSSCSQCERNQERAEELLETPAPESNHPLPSKETADAVSASMRKHGVTLSAAGYYWASLLYEEARASLASPSSGGWQWVPVEPTPEMIAAMSLVECTATCINRFDNGDEEETPILGMAGSEEAYAAMLAVAPKSSGESHE